MIKDTGILITTTLKVKEKLSGFRVAIPDAKPHITTNINNVKAQGILQPQNILQNITWIDRQLDYFVSAEYNAVQDIQTFNDSVFSYNEH